MIEIIGKVLNEDQKKQLKHVVFKLKEEGAEIDMYDDQKDKELSKKALKIYKNLKQMGKQAKKGVNVLTVIDYNKLSIEEGTEALIELKNAGKIKMNKSKEFKKAKVYLLR